MSNHMPVMLNEVLKYLQPQPGKNYIDCTLGGAGYTLALAQVIKPQGKIIGIDLDDLALNLAQQKLTEKSVKNVILIKDNFKNLTKIVIDNFPEIAKQGFDGIVFDLGLSSMQLADNERGFSFQGDHPLDMSFGSENNRLTADIINQYDLASLTAIFQEYGEERYAYRISKAIIEKRRQKRIKTTGELVEIIKTAVPTRYYSKINPATRVFQALRIETNEELLALREVLPAATKLLKPGGRLVLVSFHSGEDRIVKRFFKENTNLNVLTKKPLIPSEKEIADNPRSRSAKLRVAEKM